jgi:hypothetical protein
MQRPATALTRYKVAKRPTAQNGYAQRIPMWEAVERLGSANRGELLRELQRAGYARPNEAAVDEAYCRIELTDMTRRGFLERLGDERRLLSAEPVHSAPIGVGRVSAPTPATPPIKAPPLASETVHPEIEQALNALATALLDRSGSVFYSGRSAFSAPSRLYLLGLNPGGDPEAQAAETVAADVAQFRTQPARWSAYRDESWAGSVPGTRGMQPRVLHMLRSLEFEPDTVPASNVVFVRSPREAALDAEKAELLRLCWPVHDAVIRSLGVDTVVAFGATAGRWAREMLGVDELLDQFTETNDRRWTSYAHVGRNGRCVVTVTHPSIADWRNEAADPTPLIRRALAR